MKCRLLLTQVIQILLLIKGALSRPGFTESYNWTLTPGFNITGNVSSDIAMDDGQPADYQYTMYDEYDNDESDDLSNDEGGDNVFVPPPDLESSNPAATPQEAVPQTPDYMMELYKRFSDNLGYVHPTSNIVRSFMNINQDDFKFRGTDVQQLGDHTRVHKLVFNITSISSDEDIDYAMLRLYTLVQHDRDAYVGVDRLVSVLQDRGKDLEVSQRYEILSSRHIFGHNSGWEAFDVTSAVRRWAENISCVQILEVRIESVFNVVTEGDMDIDTDPTHRNEPLLVIFSNNNMKRKLREKELHELISHEVTSVADQGGDSRRLHKVISDGVSSHRHPDTGLLSRRKRSKKNRRNSCRRKPMYVDFKDINWHLWIIAPAGYQAFECVGKCYIPMSDHLTPTKHAIIQTLFHNTKPKDISRACCVPTKLNPISILYRDENDVFTFKYKYDGMQVAQCGCR